MIAPRSEIAVEYADGAAVEVEQHDGSVLRLRKLSASYDPGDRIAAMNYIHEHQARGEVVTGLLYVDRKGARHAPASEHGAAAVQYARRRRVMSRCGDA